MTSGGQPDAFSWDASLEEIIAGSDETRAFILSVQLRKLSFCPATQTPRAALVSAVSET